MIRKGKEKDILKLIILILLVVFAFNLFTSPDIRAEAQQSQGKTDNSKIIKAYEDFLNKIKKDPASLPEDNEVDRYIDYLDKLSKNSSDTTKIKIGNIIIGFKDAVLRRNIEESIKKAQEKLLAGQLITELADDPSSVSDQQQKYDIALAKLQKLIEEHPDKFEDFLSEILKDKDIKLYIDIISKIETVSNIDKDKLKIDMIEVADIFDEYMKAKNELQEAAEEEADKTDEKNTLEDFKNSLDKI